MHEVTARPPGESRSGDAGTGRIAGVDVARGVALLGMMAVHILPGRDPDGSESAASLVAGGRSAAAFAVLAGVGLALATRRARNIPGDAATGRRQDRQRQREAREGVAAGVVVRGLAIGAVGLVLGYLASGVAVILAYYALLFVLAAPLLWASSRVLVVVALVAATLVPVTSHVLRASLPPSRGDNPTFTTLFEEPGRLLAELTVTGYYPVLAWMTYLATGLAVGRLRLGSPRVASGLLAGGTGLALTAWAASWLLLGPLGGDAAIAATTDLGAGSAELDRLLAEPRFGTTPIATWWWLGVDAPHTTTPFDLLHTTGTALALLGLALLVTRVAPYPFMPLGAAGSMTLTLYSFHVLVVASPLLAYVPSTPEYAVHVLAALGLAFAWRSTGLRGPLEGAVAALAGRTRRAVAASRRTEDTGAGP